MASLHDSENEVPKWRIAILRDLIPLILRSISKFPDFVIYSDAATSGFRIAALFLRAASRARQSF